MNENIWLGLFSRIAKSLENIEETLAKPKNISEHRIAANRRISKAMDYIAEASIDTTGKYESVPGDTPIGMVDFIPQKKLLDDIREILCARE